RIPLARPALIEAIVRSLVPDNTLLLFAVTERGKVWTSAVLGYRDRDFWLLTSLDTVGMEDADFRGAQAEAAACMLESKFGGRVRSIVVERSELTRIFSSRFPMGDLLWALNSGDLSLKKVPRRWKALLFAGALLGSLKSR
ncbi:MAG: hypothetical protein ACYC99_13540, partial [Candidatus Geothermincolia bacterium]